MRSWCVHPCTALHALHCMLCTAPALHLHCTCTAPALHVCCMCTVCACAYALHARCTCGLRSATA